MNQIFAGIIGAFALALLGSVGYVNHQLAVVAKEIHSQPQKVQSTQEAPTLGAYSPTGGGTYRLGQSVGTSDTTIRISSFKEPVSNILYTMTYLGSDIEYGTLSPQSSISEFISFSGITQNGDGSATLTGVVRGLSRTPAASNCVASTTLAQSHAGQSIFILSNPPCLYAEYASKRNNETVTGKWVFSTSPTISNAPTAGTDAVNKAYSDAQANQGGATSTESNIGFVQLSKGSNTGTGVASSTTGQANGGAPIVIENKFATTTPGTLCNTSVWNCIVAAPSATGKISQSWLDLTATYAWTGLHTFSGGLLATASSTMNATTTIVANNVNSKALVLNGLAYAFPATQGIQNSVLTNNGSGTLSWTLTGSSLGTTTATTTAMGSGGQTLSEMTLLSMSIPGGSLGTSSVVTWDVPISTLTCSGSTNGCNQTIKIKYGGTTICTITPSFGTVSGGNNQGILRAKIIGNGLTNSQAGSCYFFATIGQQTYGAISGIQLVTTGSSAIDSTASQTFSLTIAISEGSGMISDFGLSVGTVSLAK